MRISYLRHLSCPTPRRDESRPCGGSLQAGPGVIPTRVATDDPEELLEGNIVCETCQAWYPVFAGVLILVVGPRRYLGQRFSSLMSWAGVHGDLSKEVLHWMAEEHFELHDARKVRDAPDSSAVLHYEKIDALMDKLPLPESFRSFLEEWSGSSPYDVLADMAGRLQTTGASQGEESIAVDAGCGVGGLVSQLARHYSVVFGVDISFSSVLMARSILLHRPQSYRHLVRSERDIFHPGSLDHARRPNVELLVADCAALPFGNGAANTVVSANVIEIIHPRAPLQEAQRVLREGGLLLFTDPFKFHVAEFSNPTRNNLDETKRYLDFLGMRLVEERDFVPWIWYEFQRHVQIYFNYCGAFKK